MAAEQKEQPAKPVKPPVIRRGQTKPPVVRRGQTKPFKRSTLEEQDARIDQVRMLMLSRLSRYAIHKIMRDAHGVVWQTTERYMRRARELLLAREGRPKEEHRADAISFYESVISNPSSRDSDRIKAQSRLDKLLGLETPTKVELSGPDGKPLALEHSSKPPIDYAALEAMARTVFPASGGDGPAKQVHPADADA